MKYDIWIYIFVTFAVTFAIRALPHTLFRKPVNNRFLKSFLYYVPYVTLTVMTFPEIINATGNVWSGIIAFAVAVVVAFFSGNLFYVAGSTCLVVFILGLFL